MSPMRCSSCGTRYAYALDSCTLCGAPLYAESVASGTALAVTRIETPSRNHETVPYWVVLVQDSNGAVSIAKSEREISAGDAFAVGERPKLDRTIGVLGYGVMGCGLVELLVLKGARVVWWGRAEERLARGRERVFDRLARSLDEAQMLEAAQRVSCSTSMQSLADCDLVIEAVVEDFDEKAAVLLAAEAHMAPAAILATNTSSLSIDALAARLARPERFGGLHFFNPPVRMQLVETVSSAATAPEVHGELDDYAVSLGKAPVRVAAAPGFVVNRALMKLLNEAVREMEESVASPDQIDKAIRLGLNHPMGPLELADLIGIDVVVSIMDDLAARLGDESYAPRPLLLEMIERGDLGRKTGRGFFAYESHPATG
ncbi:MAG: 3-hydroxyacyl-CoA dehydrogenase family protein [Coriobacteriia bacterium]